MTSHPNPAGLGLEIWWDIMPVIMLSYMTKVILQIELWLLISWLLVNPKGAYSSESTKSNHMNPLKTDSFL